MTSLCSSSTERFESAKALLNHGFANYALVSAQANEALPAVEVKLGKEKLLTPVLQSASPILIPKSQQASVTRTVTIEESISAPVEAGQQLGTLTIRAGEQLLAEIPIVAPHGVEKLSLWELTAELLRRICMGKET